MLADRPDDPGYSRQPSRLASLDLLRLAAFLGVLFRHAEGPPDGWPPWARLPLWTLKRGGWVGVDLFFVLSGFLVGGLLISEWRRSGRMRVGRFYLRRAWKIYPPFYALLICGLVATYLVKHAIDPGRLAIELLWLQSYKTGLWAHAWSLAVEEHFYLILPPVLWVLLRKTGSGPWRVVALAIALMIIEALARVITARYYPPNDYGRTLFPTHLRLDGLFLGVAIAAVFQVDRESFLARVRPVRWALIAVGVMLLFPAFAFPLETTPWVSTLGLGIFAIGAGFLLVGTLGCRVAFGRLFAALASVGAASYSLYLWHVAVLVWGVKGAERVFGDLGYPARMGLYVGGTFAAGLLANRIVERPALALRDWFATRGGRDEMRMSGNPVSSAADDPLVSAPISSSASP